MYEKSAFIFWLVLILYIITIFTVSYVGVYLTYIALPIIIIAGLIMKLSNPKDRTEKIISSTNNAINETGKVLNSFLHETNSALDSFNTSLEAYNEKNRLISIRTKSLRENISRLHLEKIEPEINLKYSEDELEKIKYMKIINQINNQIIEVENNINQIKKECELEIARKFR